MKNKAVRITVITLSVIIGIIILALACVKIGERIIFSEFYKDANKEFKMPGVNDGLVQQGMTYIPDKELFIIAGYMADDTASRVYVVNKSGKVLSHTQLKNPDGTDYLGHTGGVEYYGNNLYITDGTKEKGYDGGLDVFPLDEVLAGKSEAKKIGRVKTYNNPAYCHIYDGFIFVGEFYRETDYETSDSHRLETPAGDLNTALITVFKLDDSQFGVASKPCAAITTTGAIQGMYIIDGKQIVLSSSWGLSKSKLYFYDMLYIESDQGDVLIDGNAVSLYHLDSKCLKKTLEAPPMAEEIVYLDGKIYVLNESACKKYIFGKFLSANNLYSYEYKLSDQFSFCEAKYIEFRLRNISKELAA